MKGETGLIRRGSQAPWGSGEEVLDGGGRERGVRSGGNETGSVYLVAHECIVNYSIALEISEKNPAT